MSTKDMRRKMLWPPKASELDDTQFKSVFREFTPEQQTRGQGSSMMMTREDRPLTPSSEARPLTPAGSEMSLGHSSSLVSSALSNRYPQNPAEAAAHAARREARKAAKLRNAFSQADRNQTNSLDHYDMLKTLLAMELKTSPEEADMLIRQCEVDGKVDYDQILARFRG